MEENKNKIAIGILITIIIILVGGLYYLGITGINKDKIIAEKEKNEKTIF